MNLQLHKGIAIFTLLLLVISKPLAFAEAEEPKKIIYDTDGVPLVYYEEIGYQRNPVTSSFALDYYVENYKQTGNKTMYEYTLNTANWIVANAVVKGNYSILEYHFDFGYNMTSPWRSAMANGLAIKTLLKTYELTRNSTYLVTSSSLLNAFFIDVKDGGLTHKTANEGWWFEQYADETGSNPRVLSANIDALLWIHDYYIFSKDPRALYLFKQGALAVRNNLYQYDSGHYSYYASGELSNPFYHQKHIDLLNQLFVITHDPIYQEYAEQWECYKNHDDCQYVTSNSGSGSTQDAVGNVEKPMTNMIPAITIITNLASVVVGIGIVTFRLHKQEMARKK